LPKVLVCKRLQDTGILPEGLRARILRTAREYFPTIGNKALASSRLISYEAGDSLKTLTGISHPRTGGNQSFNPNILQCFPLVKPSPSQVLSMFPSHDKPGRRSLVSGFECMVSQGGYLPVSGCHLMRSQREGLPVSGFECMISQGGYLPVSGCHLMTSQSQDFLVSGVHRMRSQSQDFLVSGVHRMRSQREGLLVSTGRVPCWI